LPAPLPLPLWWLPVVVEFELDVELPESVMDVEFRLSQGGRGGVPVLLELEESDTVLLPLSMVELLEEMVELSREAVELFKDMTVPFAAMHAGGSKDESVELALAGGGGGVIDVSLPPGGMSETPDVAGADFGGAGCCRGAIEPFGVDSEPTVAGPAFFDETCACKGAARAPWPIRAAKRSTELIFENILIHRYAKLKRTGLREEIEGMGVGVN